MSRLNSRNKAINTMALLVFSGGVLLALVIPNTVLSSWTAFRSFTNFMISAVPSIDHVASISRFPDATRLFLAIMWATVPIQVMVFVLKPGGSFSVSHIKNKLLPITLLYLSLVPAIVLFAVFIFGSDFDSAGRGFYTRTMNIISNSRIALGIVSSILILSVSFFISSMILWIRNWPEIYFCR